MCKIYTYVQNDFYDDVQMQGICKTNVWNEWNDICDAHATECEKINSKMDRCKQCVDVCRSCKQERRNMIR